MHYLYGLKANTSRKLVGTFGSEQQLLAYVRWATLSQRDDVYKFEQGSVLAGSTGWESSAVPLTNEAPDAVDFNPSPAML
jgi:hypothetical protein